LPDDFFTTRALISYKNLKRIKKQKNIINEGTPTFLIFSKNQHTIRFLGIPPIENYIRLCNFIADNWKKISKHLYLQSQDMIIPYSYPLFFDGIKRSEINITNYKIYSESDIPIAVSQYEYCVFIDIKNFYSSIYTHTIAWCLDPKTQEKKERGDR